MRKRPLNIPLDPAAFGLLERLLTHYDNSVLTRSQIAQIGAVQNSVRHARTRLNLMARSEPIASVSFCDIYPHPDHRESGRMMIYDTRALALHIDTPFTEAPSEGALADWLESIHQED